MVKTNLHGVMLSEFHSMFPTYNVLPGQQVWMKCFKRTKDNIAASIITIKNEGDMDEKEEKDKTSAETAYDLVHKSLELFGCSPIKMSLQARKRKISKVTNAFSKTVAIALDKPAFG